VHVSARLAAAFFASPTDHPSARDPLLKRLDLGLDGRCFPFVLALGLVERSLRFGRRPLSPLAIPLSRGLFPQALGFAAFVLLVKVGRCLSGLSFADVGSGSFRRLRPMSCAPSPFAPDASQTGGRSARRSARSIPPGTKFKLPANSRRSLSSMAISGETTVRYWERSFIYGPRRTARSHDCSHLC
jgi:hypothetical protein